MQAAADGITTTVVAVAKPNPDHDFIGKIIPGFVPGFVSITWFWWRHDDVTKSKFYPQILPDENPDSSKAIFQVNENYRGNKLKFNLPPPIIISFIQNIEIYLFRDWIKLILIFYHFYEFILSIYFLKYKNKMENMRLTYSVVEMGSWKIE